MRGVLESTGLPPLAFISKTQRCVAHVFVLRVTDVLDEWPEAAERQRHWVRARRRGAAGRSLGSRRCVCGSHSVSRAWVRHQCRVPDAIARCRHVWMRQALEAWRERAGL